jgi:hypothetical protein
LADQVITKEQIRNLILAEKLKPSDLFGAESLTDDPVVKGYVETERRTATAGEYAHRKRTEEGFDKTRADLETQLKERDAEVMRLRLESAKGKVPTIFNRLKVERKFDEKQEKFIKANLERFEPKEVDKVEDEVKSFLDQQVDEYGRLTKLLGIETQKTETPGGTGDPGTGPEKNKPAGDQASKYLDPKRNPFIKLT